MDHSCVGKVYTCTCLTNGLQTITSLTYDCSESGVWNMTIVAYRCDPALEVLDEVE